jgi:hypothetical protein
MALSNANRVRQRKAITSLGTHSGLTCGLLMPFVRQI